MFKLLWDNPDYRLEFQTYFSEGLDALTADIRKNSQFFLIFLFVHLMLVASHAIFCSAKFGKSMMRERLMHLVSSFWLPLPFLTIRGVDRGEEKAELWFLFTIHSMENACLLLVSRWAYGSYQVGIFLMQLVIIVVTFLISLSTVMMSSKHLKLKHSILLICLLAAIILTVFASRAFSNDLPIEIVLFDCVLVILNFLGVLFSVFYVSKMELYAGLPSELPHHPSFGPADGPTGPTATNEEEAKIGEEEQHDSSQNESEDVPMDPIDATKNEADHNEDKPSDPMERSPEETKHTEEDQIESTWL